MLLASYSAVIAIPPYLPVAISAVSAIIGLTALGIQVYIHILSGPSLRWVDREIFPVKPPPGEKDNSPLWVHRLQLKNKGRKPATKVFVSIQAPSRIIEWRLQQPSGTEADEFKARALSSNQRKLELEAERCLAGATLVIELSTESADSLLLNSFSNELPANRIRKIDDLPLKGAERAISWPMTMITAAIVIAVFYIFRIFK